MDLFDERQVSKEPLAARMRPRTLDEYIGQEHIVGKGRLLRRAIAADQLTSVIFYGPPGTGKTTLARVIANHTKSSFITLNAVLTGVQHIREAVAQAERQYKLYNRRTILFVDEVHRWNKSQQDALLPWVENGTIILVGATTENPFFEVNKALVSRSRVFQLKPLTAGDLFKAAGMALGDAERGYGNYRIEFEKGALEHLVDTANGDARSLLNALELAVETTPDCWPPLHDEIIYISRETAEESIQKKVVLYDRDGDYHYDIISAFIKSLRGSDPDAAMYWLARMIAAGEDPGFIFRRMLISACEDTGLADPHALGVVESCAAAFDRVGLPEGRYHLAHAALYLATSPKSNSSMAFFDALSAVEKEDAEVPNHLKDGSRDAEGFGHGAGYMYPHAYRDHWVAQQYLPSALMGRVFYTPGDQGYEKSIREAVLARRELQIAAILEEKGSLAVLGEEDGQAEGGWWGMHGKTVPAGRDEQLTFSPKDKNREKSLDRAEQGWRKRLDSNRAELLLHIRNGIVSLADIRRHCRTLVWNADDGLLVWEAARLAPEGFTAGVCRSQSGRQILEQYAATLGSLDRPLLTVKPDGAADAGAYLCADGDTAHIPFDRILCRDCFASEDSIRAFADSLYAAACGGTRLAEGWQCIAAQKIPSAGQRVSALIREQILRGRAGAFEEPLLLLEKAEKEFFENKSDPLFSWDAERGAELLSSPAGGRLTVLFREEDLAEKRKISASEIERWFDAENSAYGAAVCGCAGHEKVKMLKSLLLEKCGSSVFDWKTVYVFYKIGM